MPGTPLPNSDCDEVQILARDNPESLNAYGTCLNFEERLAETEKVRFVRILGYLLLYAPNWAVRNEVAQCIHLHKNQGELVDLGACFERNVILPCGFHYHFLHITQPFLLSSHEVQMSNVRNERTLIEILI
jgi:hypothetical protein